VTRALLDDHLIRDLLADEVGEVLSALLEEFEPATTNLYIYRLSRSVVAAAGGALTGSWDATKRRSLGERLVALPNEIEVVPMRLLTFRMAEITAEHRVSTLGAEAIAAAEQLGGPLCVWDGDDGPGIRSAMVAVDGSYRTIGR
jgi:hypothetical protein